MSQARCPASLTFKALSPKMIEVKAGALGHGEKAVANKSLIGDMINPQELWDCTTCMGCVNACPVSIDQLGTIIDLRRYLTLSEGAPRPGRLAAQTRPPRRATRFFTIASPRPVPRCLVEK